ncbi:MAG: LysR family transcriptional regulator [Roseobacter sp.]
MNIRITLKQLETLYWIVELGTFERAAARLSATQSAVSKRVQELERGTQIEIFNRNQRGAKLTSKGEELYEVAKKMLALHDQILEMRSAKRLQSRSLKIGVTELVASTWFPQFVAATRERLPQVKLEPKVAMSRDLMSDLEQDKFDLIVISETFTLPDFVTVPIAAVEHHWVAQKGLVTGKTSVSYLELAEHTVLVQGQLSGSGLFLNRWLKQQGVMFPEILVCDSMTALLGLAVAGLGVTYVPHHFCKGLIEEGKLEVINAEVPLPPVPYVAVYREDKPHALVQEVTEVAVSSANFDVNFG